MIFHTSLPVEAIHATEILHKKYSHTFNKLDKSKTYLFEIIFPANRIVCDYGDLDDVILLAVIDNQTGFDVPLEEIGFPIVKRYDGIKDFANLRLLEEDNKEGFVIKFSNGFRVKVKFAEYVRLHRIITGISNVVIWEYLSEGKSFDELLERVPDEFYDWVKKTKYDLIGRFEDIKRESIAGYRVFESRKETAEYFKTQKYPAILFNILDGKEYHNIIWKQIRPKFCKPFKIEE